MLQKAFALIAAIAAADDEDGRARLICDGAPAAMRQPESVEAIAAAVLTSEDPQAEAASALLSAALDEARMARENGLPEGAAFIAAVEERFAEENEARPFPIEMRGRLARIHARAGLVPPVYAVLTPEVIAAEGRGVEVVPDIDALFAGILRDVGDAPLQVHAALSELLAGLMPDARAMLAGMIVERPEALEARLGLYWLLDPDPDLRLASATALLRRAEGRSLGAEAARLLPAVRKWLPAEPARAAVDATLRRWMQGGGAAAEPLKVRIARTAASLPDGVGAHSLVAAIEIGGQKGVAMAMLKQGHGVKDAFILPCTSLREQRQPSSVSKTRSTSSTSPPRPSPMLWSARSARVLRRASARRPGSWISRNSGGPMRLSRPLRMLRRRSPPWARWSGLRYLLQPDVARW
ncbi:MAG: hypothetical protein AAF565_19590 [Pseudomonadota bacterium]